MIGVEAAPAVSIFMPTHRVGLETRQDPIRLRNLLDEARARLIETGVRSDAARDILSPAAELMAAFDFWQHQEDGLALFVAPGFSRRYRLPQAFEEFVQVGEGFHIKPLLPVMSRGERFHVLALSQDQVRLLWGTRYRVGEIDLGPDVPHSMAEALWFEDRERQLQFHQTARAGQGRLVATFNGQGMGRDTRDERRSRFFRMVDRGVATLIDVDLPLVLAGVEELLPLFRSVSDHPNIQDGAVLGNVAEFSPDEVHKRAWEIAESFFLREQDAAAKAFIERRQPVADTITEVVRAAAQGRVAHLFVSGRARWWGEFDPVADVVEVRNHHGVTDMDLAERAIVDVWRHRGAVYVMDEEAIPGGGDVAAVLRY